jgi:flagellar assembly factor FliW
VSTITTVTHESNGMAGEAPVITLVEPLLGFPDHGTYSLVRLDESGLVCTLVSHDDEAVRFLVAAPHVFFPEYAPEIDDESLAALEVDTADPRSVEDLVVFVLVSSRADDSTTTANLMAPIVVNHRTHRGVQVLLADDLPMRAELTLA